nr:uncharacterized protein CFP56_12876 [Quercus suber]
MAPPPPPATKWDRLVRYVSAQDGQTRYGEPIVSGANPDIDGLAQAGQLTVHVLEGATPFLAAPTGAQDTVKHLLGPLTPRDVPIVRCTGLNYKTHSECPPVYSHPPPPQCPPCLVRADGTRKLQKQNHDQQRKGKTKKQENPIIDLAIASPAVLETGFDLPENPTLFLKPGTTVADTRAAVRVPALGQAQCDYEGELTIVLGADCKDVAEADALAYVAGYAAGNDVSCRDWQMERAKAGMMPQWCFSKSFDGYAPLGPALVSPRVLGDGAGLALTTTVNGEVRQQTNTRDLCFGVRKLVSFFSTGQTLQAGSLIMTGTPGGVGLGFKPPRWLQDGDEVAVEIEGIGKLVNVMKFE